MKSLAKKIIILAAPLIDVLFAPFTILSAIWLKIIRRVGVHRMRVSKGIFAKIGVFPIRSHYYEPLFNTSYLTKSLRNDRLLPGIDFNTQEQLKILSQFDFNDELKQFPLDKNRKLEFYYHNDSFLSGDAEYLYNVIRFYKPTKIIEIGGGNSTLMAVNAIKKNKNSDYDCKHLCIEPYEQSWLEQLDVTVVRQRVEEVDKDLFQSLNANDILFIDSSHVIRPQGDVVVEYLEILPILKSGVLVHVHDIFTPKDYLNEWVIDEVRLWNEQYLLEAFLSFNSQFSVIGALNFLTHHYPKELSDKCPILKNEISGREPGSFWIMRN
jgi:predicted O-methyltransferase YrrM